MSRSGKCGVPPKPTQEQINDSIKSQLARSERGCLPVWVNEALTTRSPDPGVSKALTEFLVSNKGSDAARVAAISYLAYVLPADKSIVNDQEPLLKRFAASNDPDSSMALALLVTRKSDADVPFFEERILAGDEVSISYSVFALAENCSDIARKALKRALGTAPVIAFQQKYQGKKTVFQRVRNMCPVDQTTGENEAAATAQASPQ